MLQQENKSISARVIPYFRKYSISIPKAYFSHDPQTEWETLANHIVFRDFGISQAQVPKLRHLLKLLALQTACLVSVDEISRLCELSKPTVYDYIQMLEALYVVYRLQPLDVADRHAISRGFKIYFWDLGLRNYFAQEFMPLDKHPQKGALFENLVLGQIRAQLAYQKVEAEIGYFRNANQSEVDVVIKRQGREKLFECKFGKQRDSIHSRLFNRDIPCINQWNWLERIYGEL